MNEIELRQKFSSLSTNEQEEIHKVINYFSNYTLNLQNNYRLTLNKEYPLHEFSFINFTDNTKLKENWLFRLNYPSTISFLLESKLIKAKEAAINANDILDYIETGNELSFPKPFIFLSKNLSNIENIILVNKVIKKVYPDIDKEIIAEYGELTLYDGYILYTDDTWLYDFDNKHGNQGIFLEILMKEQYRTNKAVNISSFNVIPFKLVDIKDNLNIILKRTNLKISKSGNFYRFIPRF